MSILLRSRSGFGVLVCNVQDVLKHGEDAAKVRAFPEHLATSGADVEEWYPRQDGGGHGVELYGRPPGKGQGVWVQPRKGGPLTLNIPGEFRGHTWGQNVTKRLLFPLLLLLLYCVVALQKS